MATLEIKMDAEVFGLYSFQTRQIHAIFETAFDRTTFLIDDGGVAQSKYIPINIEYIHGDDSPRLFHTMDDTPIVCSLNHFTINGDGSKPFQFGKFYFTGIN